MLTEFERRRGRRVFELFDLIAGTSTGGILACALCAPDPLPASELVKLYEDEGPDIFDRSLFQRIRSADGPARREVRRRRPRPRARALPRPQAALRDASPDLIVPSYDTALPGPYFFKTSKARETRRTDDFPLSVVARATSAAPTYFEPVERRRAARSWTAACSRPTRRCARSPRCSNTVSPRTSCCVSLGTGERTHKRTFDEIKDWGLAAWARPILDVVFDGCPDAVDYQLERVPAGGRYWRFQAELTLASDDLDDATEDNLAKLRGHAEELIQEHSADLDAALAKL